MIYNIYIIYLDQTRMNTEVSTMADRWFKMYLDY